MSNNQLPELPDVSFLETDPDTIIDDIISGYEEAAGRTLADGDPIRIFLLSLAYVIIRQRQDTNQTGKDNLLYYAKDAALDHIGASRNTPRIESQAAVTTVRFSLAEARAENVGIAQGTRVTHNNQLYWKTTESETITTGNLYVDVSVEAMTPGEEGNGLQVGEINRLVDPIPYVVSVQNTEETTGGRDREEDDPYRYRIYQAPAGFSIAGPEDAYIFLALSANSSIVDVYAHSPTDGVVEIRPLLDGGEIPTQSVLEQVEAACSPKDKRPLTDKVNVVAPNPVNYTIEATYYIRTEDGPSAQIIQDRVNQAVTEYIEWQQEKLGRDIDPGELNARVRAAGAKRIAITTPTLQALQRIDVAKANTITVNYGGLEDE